MLHLRYYPLGRLPTGGPVQKSLVLHQRLLARSPHRARQQFGDVSLQALVGRDDCRRGAEDRAANFDIYLPNWLARNNKAIFGILFALYELIVLWRWLVQP
jgi:hypothetical protein